MKHKKAEDLECFVMFNGEETLHDCLAAIDRQSLQPASVDSISYITPLHGSLNYRRKMMTLKYSVKVDADMILYPTCFQLLYDNICESNDSIYAVTGMLKDPFLGVIGAVHIEKTEVVRNIIVPDAIGCDRVVRNEMKERGFSILELSTVVGEHWCDWSAEAIFKRHVRVGQKLAYYENKHYDDWIKTLLKKVGAGSNSAFLALLGLSYGLMTDNPREKHDGFCTDEWNRVCKLMNASVLIPEKNLELLSFKKKDKKTSMKSE